ncbi:MAG: tRNA epoxyqueuosine(34) reductase QueG, partial [Rhodoplanes sp.]
IAFGNSGDIALAPKAEDRLGDPSPLVRGAAVWALSRLLTHEAFAALAKNHHGSERDASVQEEWAAAQGAWALG